MGKRTRVDDENENVDVVEDEEEIGGTELEPVRVIPESEFYVNGYIEKVLAWNRDENGREELHELLETYVEWRMLEQKEIGQCKNLEKTRMRMNTLRSRLDELKN